jgi:galactokinase
MEIDSLKKEFQRFFPGKPQIFRAPGRVNLIGEHTDYNDGFVMPAAIDFYTWVALAPRSDSKANVRSQSFGDGVSVDLSASFAAAHNWSDYVLGVLDQIRHAGLPLTGADILIHGEVPMGAGLSSSAAIEVATGLAVLETRHAGSRQAQSLDRTQLALLCQRAENEFVGMRCGIMDQFISCQGKHDHALLLDCRTLEFKLLPMPPEARMVICNTMVKHQHASGEYNQRRAACEEGVRILKQHLPSIRALRDVSLEQLDKYSDTIPGMVYRRCRHVITENDRVLQAASMLQTGDLKAFGILMGKSHASLRDDYEVSCRELDIMVELANRQPGIYGARMTGGGFGGCTINLVAADEAEGFRESVAAAYQQATGLKPQIYISSAADGASRVA